MILRVKFEIRTTADFVYVLDYVSGERGGLMSTENVGGAMMAQSSLSRPRIRNMCDGAGLPSFEDEVSESC